MLAEAPVPASAVAADAAQRLGFFDVEGGL
jgi:hypothetical protein